MGDDQRHHITLKMLCENKNVELSVMHGQHV